MTRIPKKPLFSNLSFSILFLSIYLILPFIFVLERGSFRLGAIFFYPYLSLIIILSFFNLRSRRKERALDLNCQAIEEEINIAGDAIRKRNALVRALKIKLKRFSKLKDFTDKLTTAVSLDDVASIILEEATQLIPQFISCVLYLINPKTYELNCFLSKVKEPITIKTKKGDIFDHWVVKKMQPLLVEDVSKDFRFDTETMDKEDKEKLQYSHSIMAAPLLTYNKMIGILRLDTSHIKGFSQEDLRLLVTVSDLAAAAIDNAILYKHTLDLAIRDTLTGLYLKKYFIERLEEELQRVSIKKGHLSLLMLDIDKFKDFNDHFGHIAGDIVLKTVSKILQDSVEGAGNIICRFGGEEFIVLLTDTKKSVAIHRAKDLHKKIKSEQIILRRKVTKITVCIGVVSCPEDGYEFQDLMRKVDSLVYKAKREGRDKVCFLES